MTLIACLHSAQSNVALFDVACPPARGSSTAYGRNCSPRRTPQAD
jgi:hypothetical protein